VKFRFRVVASGVALIASLAVPGAATASFPGANGRISFSLRAADLEEPPAPPAPGPYAFDHTGTITLPAGTGATWSSDGRKLLMRAPAGGIVVIAPDGSEKRVITTDTRDADPTWSNDGKWAAFERGGEIWVASLTGGGERRLTTGENPSWSPDGTRIAFTAWGNPDEGGGAGISIINVDGTGLKGLTPALPLSADLDPDWSPDSQRVAYWTPHARHPGQVNVVDVATKAIASIEAPEEDDRRAGDRFPAWAPDGGRIAFARLWTRWIAGPPTGGPDELSPGYVVSVRPDGADERVETSLPNVEYEQLAWQPLNRPPAASIAVDPAQPMAGKSARLVASVLDPDGPIQGVHWDLDEDGEFDDAHELAANWVFAAPGPHTVRLQVRDNNFERFVSTKTVSVVSSAGVGSSGAPTEPTAPGSEGGVAGSTDRPPALRSVVIRTGLRTALRRGLKIRIRLSEPATVAVAARLERRLAHRLNLKRVVARARSAEASSDQHELTLTFGGKARRTLGRRRSVDLSLRFELVDASGNRTVLTRRVRLKR